MKKIPSDVIQRLEEGLSFLGINVTSDNKQKLIDYVQLLLQWNRVYNLTAITDPIEIIDKHILDSLAIQPFLQGDRMLDVGCGAGLPAIPLAILNQGHWHLVDSNQKKTLFLQQAKLQLKLNTINIHHQRIEDFHDYKFDLIVSRAFTALKKFFNLTSHLADDHTHWLAMKGQCPEEELLELEKSLEFEKLLEFEESVELTSLPINLTVHRLNISDWLKAERHVVIMKLKRLRTV